MKIIHQIWWQGESAVPEKYSPFRDAMHAFLAMHPEFEYMFWDETSCMDIVKEVFPHGLDVMDKLKLVEKCDMARLAILFKYGGVYLDMDFLVQPSFDRFLELYGAPDRVILPKELLMVNNYMIVASRENLIIRELFDECVRRIQHPTLVSGLSSTLKTLETTGPTMFSKVLHMPAFRDRVVLVDVHDLYEFGYHTAETEWVSGKSQVLMNLSGMAGAGLDVVTQTSRQVSEAYISSIRHELFLPVMLVLSTTITIVSPSLLLGLFVVVLVLYMDLRMYASTMNQSCHNHLSAYLVVGVGFVIGSIVKAVLK